MADLVFVEVKVEKLVAILQARLPDAYPGGSNLTDLKKFKSYVSGKDEAQDFTQCAWVPTTNAKTIENLLLSLCSEKGCNYNTQQKSNVRDAPGFAYVLYS